MAGVLLHLLFRHDVIVDEEGEARRGGEDAHVPQQPAMFKVNFK